MNNLAKSIRDIALESPYVMGKRISGFMMPGAVFSARDQREATRMILEKQSAAIESFSAAALAYQSSMISLWFAACTGRVSGQLLESSANSVAQAAIAPYRDRVKKNAKRLKRRKA